MSNEQTRARLAMETVIHDATMQTLIHTSKLVGMQDMRDFVTNRLNDLVKEGIITPENKLKLMIAMSEEIHRCFCG